MVAVGVGGVAVAPRVPGLFVPVKAHTRTDVRRSKESSVPGGVDGTLRDWTGD
jgi:hypothetical protein